MKHEVGVGRERHRARTPPPLRLTEYVEASRAAGDRAKSSAEPSGTTAPMDLGLSPSGLGGASAR